MKKINLFVFLLLLFSISSKIHCQTYDIDKSLKGFDKFVDQIMKDGNSPGIAVGIIIKDKLVYSKGYGYRDLENKLPVTSKTLFPIASNTKLFTSFAMGMLVEEGKLAWDKPISTYVPQIKFYNQELYNSVTLRDMLAHRTGIPEHYSIWYQSDFSRKELFDRLVYLEPVQPIRQSSTYNNLIYAAVGYCLEIITGTTWEDFIQENIFNPLNMNSTLFSIEDMEMQNDFAYPYYEENETDKLIKGPYYRGTKGFGPAGAIISNIEDMSKWVITLMNQGNYKGKNVISLDIINETLQPAMAEPNTALETEGYDEILNSVSGMGRYFAAYKGHFLTSHGGFLGGFHSQVSMMPYDSIGALVFVNGTHNGPLIDIISYNIYDRLLKKEQTDFNSRSSKNRIEGKKAIKEARKITGSDKVDNTKPSHALTDYEGQYENSVYGILKISIDGNQLEFDFHNIVLPLEHYHFDRFDTSNDPVYGIFTVYFYINPQGDIHNAVMSLDRSEVVFTKKPDASLSDPNILSNYVGSYELAGQVFEVIMSDEGVLSTGTPDESVKLIPYKSRMFTLKEFPDYIIEFIMKGDEVMMMRWIMPHGTFDFTKK